MFRLVSYVTPGLEAVFYIGKVYILCEQGKSLTLYTLKQADKWAMDSVLVLDDRVNISLWEDCLHDILQVLQD